MKQRDLDWLAGLLEGEGCFGTTRNHVKGHIYAYPQIQLRMCDQDIVLRAAQLLGVSYHGYARMPPRNRYWQLSLTGGRATLMMQELEPLMGQRRSAKIRAILKRGPYRIS